MPIKWSSSTFFIFFWVKLFVLLRLLLLVIIVVIIVIISRSLHQRNGLQRGHNAHTLRTHTNCKTISASGNPHVTHPLVCRVQMCTHHYTSAPLHT